MDTFQILMALAGCWNLFLTARAVKRGSWSIGSNVYSRIKVPIGFWFFTFCCFGAGAGLLFLPLFVF
jgi:hypothetical protein